MLPCSSASPVLNKISESGALGLYCHLAAQGAVRDIAGGDLVDIPNGKHMLSGSIP